NGKAITDTQIRVTGPGASGSWETVRESGTRNVGAPYSQNFRIEVRVRNDSTWSSVASASATTDKRPEPKAKTVKGASGSWPSGWGGSGACTTYSCAYMAVEVTNFPAGNYRLY